MPLRRYLDGSQNPARFVLLAFVSLITLGTAALALPMSVDGPGRLPLVDALFTATSAATVTGLGTVPATDFSIVGELVILALIQVGGFGIMTIGAVMVLLTARRVGLRQRMLARTEIGAVSLGDLRVLILGIAKFTIVVEAAVAALLLVRFAADDGAAVGNPVYSAVFHAVSAFNNAGITLYDDSLTRYVGDPLVTTVVSTAFVVGGLGFPILIELQRRVAPARWSIHTKITLLATAALLTTAPIVVLVLEWTNPATLGPLTTGDKLLAGWFTGATPRTAGFEVVSTGSLHEPTQVFLATLMFIGAGPASTSGGIKVTTFAVLAFVLWSQVRGDSDVNVFRRRLPDEIIRQAVTVALLGVGLVIGSGLALVLLSDATLTPAVFEAASAFGTVGLSTGLTPELPTAARVLLVVVMLAGRVGVATFVTALALRSRSTAYRYPEERPIIG